MNATVPVAGIGSGSCWEDPSEKGKYIINYSEDINGNPYGTGAVFDRNLHPKMQLVPMLARFTTRLKRAGV
jgi:hypothetical protein